MSNTVLLTITQYNQQQHSTINNDTAQLAINNRNVIID